MTLADRFYKLIIPPFRMIFDWGNAAPCEDDIDGWFEDHPWMAKKDDEDERRDT